MLKFLILFAALMPSTVLLSVDSPPKYPSASTRSGLYIEILSSQARCRRACWPETNILRGGATEVLTIFRITNRSDLDPKQTRPCNLSAELTWSRQKAFYVKWAHYEDIIGGAEPGTEIKLLEANWDRYQWCNRSGEAYGLPKIPKNDSIVVAMWFYFQQQEQRTFVSPTYSYDGDAIFQLGEEVLFLKELPFTVVVEEFSAGPAPNSVSLVPSIN